MYCSYCDDKRETLPVWVCYSRARIVSENDYKDCPTWEEREDAYPRKDSDADWFILRRIADDKGSPGGNDAIMARCILDLCERLKKADA